MRRWWFDRSLRLAELEEARGEIDRFFSISIDLLCIADAEGRFIRVNPAWTEVLGYSEAELTSAAYIEFVHPDDRDATAAAAGRLANGATVVDFENRYRHKDGTYRWLNWRAAPAPKGNLVYAAARDVTEQKAANASLEAARREAETASHAKSDFLSRMSHDLRTPLNAVLGFAQLLAREETNPERRESIKQILSGGKHLLELINEVLDIARIEAGHLSLSPEAVDVAEIAGRVLELVAPLASEHNVTLAAQPEPPAASAVIADRQRLTQILLNLVSNAVKYNRAGGRVTVEFSQPQERRLRISVVDTGAGIPPDKLRLLFNPFERLGAEHTATQGTGLGLAISRGLARAMGGTMGVESEVDRGSRFWLELAVSDQVPAAARQEESAVSSGEASEGTILYIEDNASNARLMNRIVKRRPGVMLLHAPDGALGIALARQHEPDVIFLDLHLPDMNGEEVLRRLWEDPSLRNIPVAVLSADATAGQVRRLKASGAAAYLTKPLDVANVLALIDTFLAGEARPDPVAGDGA